MTKRERLTVALPEVVADALYCEANRHLESPAVTAARVIAEGLPEFVAATAAARAVAEALIASPYAFYDETLRQAAAIAEVLDAVMLAARVRDYHIEYLARRTRGESRGISITEARGHGRGVKGAQAALRSKKGLLSASPRQLEHRSQELEGLRRLRAGEASSPTDAERQLGLSRGSLRKDLPTAFDKRGRVKSSDSEAIVMRIIGTEGDVLAVVRGSRQRKLVGNHRSTVLAVLAGDLPPSALDKFHGKVVSGVELETDLRRLRVLNDAGLIEGGPYPEAVPQ